VSFLQFFQESNGRLSSTRLAFLLWAIGVLVTWMSNSLTTGELHPIPESIIALMGILMTGKVVQKTVEEKVPEKETTRIALSSHPSNTGKS
jgi:hypothetical protein